jgi:hypothetical protein
MKGRMGRVVKRYGEPPGKKADGKGILWSGDGTV